MMIDPISAISIAGSGITVTTSPDYLLDGLTAGYVLLTLALAIIAFRSLKQTQASLDLTRKQIELNTQQSQEASSASERHSQATIDAVNMQIAASEIQAQEALYNQHKPVIVPINTPHQEDQGIYSMILQNQGAGVALNTWGLITMKGKQLENIPLQTVLPYRYFFVQTYFLIPGNPEQIAFRIAEPGVPFKQQTLLSNDMFEGYSIYPLQDTYSNKYATMRLMITYNDAFNNKYLVIFDNRDSLGWRQVEEIKRVEQRLDERLEIRDSVPLGQKRTILRSSLFSITENETTPPGVLSKCEAKSRPLDSPTVFSKHDILIHGSRFTVCLTGGRHASPDRHDRKETIACPPKTPSTRRRRRSPRRRARDLRTRNEAR